MIEIQNAIVAGTVYFVAIFVVGFLLGAVRATSVAPRLGELRAVALETPFILAASWIVSAWLMDRYTIAASFAAAATMGGFAFLLLQILEISASLKIERITLRTYIRRFRQPAGYVGLLVQILFSLCPVAQNLLSG